MKVEEINENVTRYVDKNAVVLVDRAAKQICFDYSDNREHLGKSKKVNITRKAVIVNNNATGTVKAISDAFVIDLNTRTNEASITLR